tara:strand:- start:15 stop:740 length:726 start_codon:yes stop_codon:yes gene_type:complete
MCKLGVNIDHIATLRNARGENHPNLIQAVRVLEECNVDSITMHLREDRRHIMDEDLFLIKKETNLPINLEIAPTLEMVNIAKKLKPRSICFVPEKREEITTEGGLDVVSNFKKIKNLLNYFKTTDINIAFFIEPSKKQIDALVDLNIKFIEFHTGAYALSKSKKILKENLISLSNSVEYASNLGITCHAGHGLNFDNVSAVARIPNIKELNIGHFIIADSIFNGLRTSVLTMKSKMVEISK